MNILVKNYCVMVEFPDVSGAEHLEMLQLRDELSKLESQLSEEEKGLLANADRRLVEQAREFYEELDVLALLPNLRKQELTSGVV